MFLLRNIEWYGFLFFWIILITSSLSFAEQEPEKSIVLKDLITEALNQNPDLRASRFDAEGKEAKIGPSGSYEDPMISLEAQNYPVDTLSSREFGMTGNQISVLQKIPFPGKLSKLRLAATYEYNAQRETYTASQLNLIKMVRMGFYGLFLSHKRKEILEEQLNIIRQLISVIRSRYILGKVTQAELLSFQLEEANLLSELLTAQKQIDLKTGDLNHALGRAAHHTIGRPENLLVTSINLNKVTEQSIINRALARNPSLKSMKNEAEAAESRLSYARWNYLPDFEFKFGYMLRQPSPGDRGVNFISGGVGLTIPLWALSKQSEEVKSAAASHTKAEAKLEEQRNKLLHDIHNLYAELKEAHKRLNLYESGTMPLAKQAVITGKSAYLSGKMEYTAVLNLVRSRFQTEIGYFETLTQHEEKITELEALLGEPVTNATEAL